MIRCSLEEKNLIIEFLTSELDHHITNEVRDEIDIILDSKSIKNIIFDFKNIRFMGFIRYRCNYRKIQENFQ